MFGDIAARLLSRLEYIVDLSFIEAAIPVLPFQRQPVLEFGIADVDTFEQFVGDLIRRPLRPNHQVGIEHESVRIQPNGILIRNQEITCRPQTLMNVQKRLA